MQEINEFYNAIDDSGLLSSSQKNILKYIVSFDPKRGVPASSIMEYTQISKQAVNFSLQQLIKRNFISRKKDRVFVYTVNQIRLSELLEDYKKKKSLKID
jgi:DNA-binding MarR family transcriptional regulator